MDIRDDPFDLARFVQAQEGCHDEALAEIRAGRKRTHWSWFVLPQVAGLGSSAMSQRYAISGLAEARAYLAHPVLGARLRECVAAMNAHGGHRSAQAVLGDIDALKFRSCLTLFAKAAPDDALFREGLRRFFEGRPDPVTLELLG